MIGEILRCSVSEVIKVDAIPDGRHEAIHAGYQVSWRVDSRSFIARTGDRASGFVKGFVVIESEEIRFEKANAVR